MTNANSARLLFTVAAMVAIAIYYQGLSGPYLFDDFWNLAPVERWADGALSWRQALLPNWNSFVDSRPVSMASFMLTTWLSGAGTFPLKAGNLLIHLLCGAAAWGLMTRLMRDDPSLAINAGRLAAFGAAMWMLHPLHVSTVLYAVQRMTQLSALFTLLAILAYMHGRELLRKSAGRQAIGFLFVAFPLMWMLGTLSKQNAIVAPFLCLAIELAYYGNSWTKIRALRVFFLGFAFLPLLAAVMLFFIRPELVTAGYVNWDFTLGERLLTQARVLTSYLNAFLIPYAPAMGLYTDDYVVSKSLLQPITTSLAIIGLFGISIAVATLRTRAPTLFAGWFFFLIAHSLEAGPLPLEMYYEHRNYLPSFGLILAGISLSNLLYKVVAPRTTNPRAVAIAASGLLMLVLSFATLGRVLVWQSTQSIVTQGLVHHPRSLHAILDAVALAIEGGDYGRALAILGPLIKSDSPRVRMVAKLYIASIQCVKGPGLESGLLAGVSQDAMPRLTIYDVQMMKSLESASQQPACRGKVEKSVADTFVKLLGQATAQSESVTNKSVPRELAARLYVRAGEWTSAEHQAEVAWRSTLHPQTGALLARIYLQQGKVEAAGRVIEQLSVRIDEGDAGGQAELATLKSMSREATNKRAVRSLPHKEPMSQ